MNKALECWNKTVAVLEKASWFPPLLARITIGGVFVESGWGKLHDIPKVTGFFTELGIPAPHFHAVFVSGVELVCGFFVLIGLLTRIMSAPLIGTMVVAIITAKRSELNELTDLFGFIEYLYIVLLVWLVIKGPGCVSADHFLCKKCKK